MTLEPIQPPSDAIDLTPPSRGEAAAHEGSVLWVAPSSLKYAFSRGGGPGGQAVNKLSTRVEMRVAIEAIVGLDEAARARLRSLAGRRLLGGDELVFVAEEHRSQLANRRAALDRLRALVAEAATPPKPRKPTRPTRASVEKRLEAKRAQAKKKDRRRATRADDEEG
ncbi:MAG: alternative ribosome rescue aminoacyl-tRNA hydrolase ArfB [Planctomycetota bacterium]|jgi:ribosome-associated protein